MRTCEKCGMNYDETDQDPVCGCGLRAERFDSIAWNTFAPRSWPTAGSLVLLSDGKWSYQLGSWQKAGLLMKTPAGSSFVTKEALMVEFRYWTELGEFGAVLV